MKFEYGSKSQEFDGSGRASATKVMLVNADGASVPIFLPPDKIDLSNSELLELALEAIYQDNFPMRAENEKFNNLEDALRKADEAVKEAHEATIANRQAVDQAIVEMTDLVASIYAKLAESGIITEEDDDEQTN